MNDGCKMILDIADGESCREAQYQLIVDIEVW